MQPSQDPKYTTNFDSETRDKRNIVTNTKSGHKDNCNNSKMRIEYTKRSTEDNNIETMNNKSIYIVRSESVSQRPLQEKPRFNSSDPADDVGDSL